MLDFFTKNLYFCLLFSKMDKKLLFLLSSQAVIGAYAQQQSPNVILIVVDDLGFNDLQAYGNTRIRTPNIDALGNQGVRCTHAYASSPISGPSRAAILTGRYQNRFGCEFMPYDKFDKSFMKDFKKYYLSFKKKPEGLKTFSPNIFVRRGKYKTELPKSEIIIAELMKKAGYATGLIGKWNIGSDIKNSPDKYGYDYSYYFAGALTRYIDEPIDTSKYVNMPLPWAFSDIPAWQKRAGATAIRENNKEVKDTGYLTFSFANKAVEFIDKNKNNPFFLTLTFNAPHDPFQAPKAYYNHIHESDPVKKIYYAMIEALDDAMGDVVAALKEHNLYDNTLIIFTSDNGGAAYTRATDNGLCGGKCTLFDGGLRVPFYIRFPQTMLNQSVVYEHPVSTLDIFSTITSVANVPVPNDRTYDGVNLLPYLQDESSECPHQCLYWRNGYVKACIIDHWKLYIAKKDKKVFLFDLSNDPKELNNLAELFPEKVKEMEAVISEWEKTQTVKPLWPSSGNVTIEVNGRLYHFPV